MLTRRMTRHPDPSQLIVMLPGYGPIDDVVDAYGVSRGDGQVRPIRHRVVRGTLTARTRWLVQATSAVGAVALETLVARLGVLGVDRGSMAWWLVGEARAGDGNSDPAWLCGSWRQPSLRPGGFVTDGA